MFILIFTYIYVFLAMIKPFFNVIQIYDFFELFYFTQAA